MTISWIFRRAAFTWLCAFSAAAWAAGGPCQRVVAVGDLHGGYDGFRDILIEAGVIDGTLAWRDDGACLVQVGDIVDRGGHSRRVLDLLMALEEQAPERVYVLLGNHEALTLVRDLRYVGVDEYAEFAEDESDDERERALREFAKRPEAAGMNRKARRLAFDRRYPRGWFARQRAFAPDGTYGRWLLARPTVLVLADTLFVHAGLGPEDAKRDPAELNAAIVREIAEYIEVRDRLVDGGVLDPWGLFEDHALAVRSYLHEFDEAARLSPGDAGATEEPDTVSDARDLAELYDATFLRQDGPLWIRDLAKADDADLAPVVDAVLESAGARRIAVGHSVRPDGRIQVRLDGRVFLIDSGAAPHYGGRSAALEIRGDTVRAVYLDRVDVLAAPAGTAAPVALESSGIF